jgi:predicted SAM-dependent methyltransferase
MISEKKLNLACGQNKGEGFFGIDVVKTEATDAVIDLEKYPWDIESESAEEIFCSHYVEHINHDSVMKNLIEALANANTFDSFKKQLLSKVDYINRSFTDPFMPSEGLFKFMDEVYRILKPQGKVTIIAPYYSSMRAFQDPTHKRSICEVTFMYFNKNWRDMNRLDHYQVKCDYDFTYGYDMPDEWKVKHEEARAFAIAHYWNIVNDIQVVLTKR